MKDIITRMLIKERHNIKRHFEIPKIYEKYISKSKRHLDFGCGFGCESYLIASSYPEIEVIGIDRRREDLMIGKKRYTAPNLTLLVSNKIKGKFDTISCFNVLHTIVGDLNYYLKEFYSHLKPHGRIIIRDMRKVSKERFMKYFYKPRIKEIKTKAYKLDSFEEEYNKHNKWTIKQFVSMIEKAGFKTLEVKTDKLGILYVGEKK